MRFLARFPLCFMFFCSACTCSFGVGRVTVDPNHGGTISHVEVQGDPRLAQKVTYAAKFTSVQQIIADLAKMTGVKLLAGAGASDWPVRSRKMNIFVKDVKMADLMNSIAHTMKFVWSRSKDPTPPTYRLLVDKKAAAIADSRKSNAEKASEQLWSERRAEWIDIIMRDGVMSPQQVEATRTTDPVFYRYARGGDIRGLRALFNEVPEAKDRFASGQNFRISADKLSANTRGLLYSTADEFCKFMQMGRRPVVGLGNWLKLDDNYDIAYVRLDVGSFTPNSRWGVYTYGSTGYFHIARRESDIQVADLKDRSSEIARLLCERENSIIDTGDRSAPNTLFYSHAPELEAERKREVDSLYPSEPLNKHASSPELEKTVKLKIGPPEPGENKVMATCNYVASFQKALAEATGMDVVSDSWVNIEGDKVPGDEAPIVDLLNEFSKRFDYNWDKSTSILEFRHRKWWKNRLNQISDDRVATWSENTAQNGMLSLDDLAHISDLNYYQAEESLKADKVIGSVYGSILTILDTNGNLDWLRLYSALSSDMRALLMGQGGATGQGGVNGHMLTSEQWKLAQTMFDRIGSERSDALFYLDLLPSETNVIYQFREIDTESGAEDRVWKVILPKYAPPATAEQSPPK